MKVRIIHLGAVLSLLASGLLLGSSTASAHGGEDHGDAAHATPLPAMAAAPRADAQSDEFELVAVLEEGGQMRLTLDRFATNAPVVGAKLEVDGNGQNAVATETSPGVYVAKLGALAGAAPGTKLPLTISIETGDSADLLMATLEIPAPVAGGVTHVRGWSETVTWLLSAVFGLAAVALLIARRNRQNKKGVR